MSNLLLFFEAIIQNHYLHICSLMVKIPKYNFWLFLQYHLAIKPKLFLLIQQVWLHNYLDIWDISCQMSSLEIWTHIVLLEHLNHQGYRLFLFLSLANAWLFYFARVAAINEKVILNFPKSYKFHSFWHFKCFFKVL